MISPPARRRRAPTRSRAPADLSETITANRSTRLRNGALRSAQLTAAVLGNTTIEVFNEIPVKEMRADSLTELDLKSKGIGVEGGMVVAGLLPIMGSVMSVR